MADSRNNETYTGDTLVKAPDVHGSYVVKAEKETLAISNNMHLTKIDDKHQKYLDYHREYCLL